MSSGNGADERFAANLRAAREHAGLSQAALAAKMAELGTPLRQQLIARIEQGQRKVSLGEAIVLAQALGTTADALTRALSTGQQAAVLAQETAAARSAHSAAAAAAERFCGLRELLGRRIAATEADGTADALKAELDAARGVLALPWPLEDNGGSHSGPVA